MVEKTDLRAADGSFAQPQKKAEPGMEIVMTGWAGMADTVELIRTHRTELLTRFSSFFLDEANQYAVDFTKPAGRIAEDSGAVLICGTAKRGVFGALWTLGERAGMGLSVELNRIPIRQETVEICNYFDRNPYLADGPGNLLIVTEKGFFLQQQLWRAGIPAQTIGTMQKGIARIVTNGEETRYLEPYREKTENRSKLCNKPIRNGVENDGNA